MRFEYSISYILRLTGLFIIVIGIILAFQIVLQALSWTVRLSLIGVCDPWEAPQTYSIMRSYVMVNLVLAATGTVFLSDLSYPAALVKKPWKLLDFKRTLATMVLTGGTVFSQPSAHKYCIRYYGKSLLLHDVLCALVRRIYHVTAEPAKWASRGSYVTQIYNRQIVEELLSFSSTYSTRKGRDNENHLYPSAIFLADAPYDVLSEAVRLGASANGGVRCTIEPISNANSQYYVRPQFTFGYLSPKPLLDDYESVLGQAGIRMVQVMDKRFGRGFLLGRSWEALEAFRSIGGFLDGVKVDRGRFKGLERNHVLQALLAFHRGERNCFFWMQTAWTTVFSYFNVVREFTEEPAPLFEPRVTPCAIAV
jgi:hypothetical protein